MAPSFRDITYPVRAETLERPLAEWERAVLEKLRYLRLSKKTGILYVTESGAIQIFEGVRAGIVPP